MESVLKTVLKHAESHQVNKVVAINLRVGELTDLLDEWMQRYFDYLSKDTLAAGALLKIERTPAVLTCNTCGHSFAVQKDDFAATRCSQCAGSELALQAGREFLINNIEVL